MNHKSGLFSGKKILFGITGSIAAYKTVDWVRNLVKEGTQVKVVMTKAGTKFVTPLTLTALTGNKVHEDMFDPVGAENIPHINLAKECDLVLIAPATAQTISRMALGLASDLLSSILLATKAKVLVCPAMNSNMFLHPATQNNIARIKGYGYQIIEPETGLMACGDDGPGRLPAWETVRPIITACFTPQDMQDHQVLITAGPTYEPIDPVRFIGNRSSGKMGFALAEAAKIRGAHVTLISGPTALHPLTGVDYIPVQTAEEMRDAVLDKYAETSVVVMSAAVSDYRPSERSDQKIKKTGNKEALSLLPNPDILRELGQNKGSGKKIPLLVGFAAESRDHLVEGRRKLQEKNLDLVVVNDILGKDTGFAADTNQVTLLDSDGQEDRLPLLSKMETAHRIWDRTLTILHS